MREKYVGKGEEYIINMSKKPEGFRIDHNYDELESGTSYIMVAKDTLLVDGQKDILVDQATELEIPELQSAYQQKLKLQRKEEVKRVRLTLDLLERIFRSIQRRH